MTRYITILLTSFILLFCQTSLGQNNNSAFYKIEIKNWGLLISGNTNWTITNSTISVLRQNINGSIDTFSKRLSMTENNIIISNLTKINLTSINESNVDNSAPDDMGEFDLEITFDKTTKEFHIYQVKIDDVFNLVFQVNKYLPDKYHIGYDENYFRFKK